MANVIKLKQSSVTGRIPGTGDLVQGELAVNTVDEKIYTKNSSGAIVELGGGFAYTTSSSAPSSPTLGDSWYNPTTNELKIRVKDAANVAFWLLTGSSSSYVVELSHTLSGGDSLAYSYDASEIFDAGDATTEESAKIVRGGTA